MTSYTPGPWTIHDEGDDCLDIRSDGGSPPIATLGWHVDDTSSQANARLVAAAPDLYEALLGMECAGCHLILNEDYNRPCPDCAPAFAALEKARGEPALWRRT